MLRLTASPKTGKEWSQASDVVDQYDNQIVLV